MLKKSMLFYIKEELIYKKTKQITLNIILKRC